MVHVLCILVNVFCEKTKVRLSGVEIVHVVLKLDSVTHTTHYLILILALNLAAGALSEIEQFKIPLQV